MQIDNLRTLFYPLGNLSKLFRFTCKGIMEISVGDRKLRKAIEDETASRKLLGPEMAKKLILRLTSLRAAASLAIFWPPKSGPERCHELSGKLEGIFSVDLKHPYRLLFRPKEVDKDVLLDGRERWEQITAITLTSIEDTHE